MNVVGRLGFAVVLVCALSACGDSEAGGPDDAGSRGDASSPDAASGDPGEGGAAGLGGFVGGGGGGESGRAGGGAGSDAVDDAGGDAGGSGSDGGDPDAGDPDGGPPDGGGADAGPTPFALELPSSDTTLIAGTPVMLEVSIVRDAGYEGTVTVSLDDLPAGVSSNVAEVMLTDDMTRALFVLTASLAATPTAGVEIVVSATSSRGAATDTFTLVVSAPPDFTASVPGGISTRQGAAPSVRVEIARGSGFTGPVQVSLSGASPTITAAPLTIDSGQSMGDLVLDIDPAAALQSYDVDVHFVAGAVDVVGVLTVGVGPAVSVTITPPSGTVVVPVGSSLEVSFDLEASEPSTWRVTLSGLPPGITSTPDFVSVGNMDAAMVAFTLTAAGNAGVGASSNALVSADPAQSDGTLPDSASFAVEVGAQPAFTASTPTPALELVRGQPMDVTVNVVRDTGFTDALTITAPAPPPTLAVGSAGIGMGAGSGTATLTPSADDALDESRNVVLDVGNGTAVRQVALSVRTRAGDPDLDADFGYHGVDVTPTPFQHARSVRCVDTDACYRTTNNNVRVTKLDVDGVYDGSYGSSGAVDLGGAFHFAELAPNGDLLVGSYSGIESALRIHRVSASGALVTSFGDAGVVRVRTSPAGSDIVAPLDLTTQQVLAVVDAGGLYLVGQGGSAQEIVMVRIDAAGALDAAFAGDGIASSSLADAGFPGAALVWQGRLMVARSQGTGVLLSAFTAAGVPDASFDADGFATVGTSGCDYARPIALHGTATRLLVVRDAYAACTHLAFALGSAGALDTGYGSAGYLPSNGATAELAAFDAQGRMVTFRRATGESRVQLLRYLPSGALDASFASAGVAELDVAPAGVFEIGSSLAVLPNGSYLLSGYVSQSLHAFEAAFLP